MATPPQPKKRKRSVGVQDVPQSNDGEPRRSHRMNIGKNGRTEQMQKVGVVLEKKASRKPRVAVTADDVPINPMAPVAMSKKRKKKKANAPGEPEVSPYIFRIHLLGIPVIYRMTRARMSLTSTLRMRPSRRATSRETENVSVFVMFLTVSTNHLCTVTIVGKRKKSKTEGLVVTMIRQRTNLMMIPTQNKVTVLIRFVF